MSPTHPTPSSPPSNKPPYRHWPHAPSSYAEGLGRLSLLTPAVVAAAASSQIRTGQRVGLNWSMTKLECAAFGREAARHRVLRFGGKGEGGEEGEAGAKGAVAFDDVYEFNPQQSSQWDGLRHFSQPGLPSLAESPSQRFFYGGVTGAEILDRRSDRIGMQHWAREGIAGRGVLIDYASWAAARGIAYSAFSQHVVTMEEIRCVAEEEGVKWQEGDILFVRMGVVREWEGWTRERKEAYARSERPMHAGVEATEEVLSWLWREGFAAVAGDALSWEVYPPTTNLFLHEWLLAGWGMPIGEMFDLEALAETCRELKRWTFFVTSMPLNMPGGVSSPPNAMAIF